VRTADPRQDTDVEALVVLMAKENQDWGIGEFKALSLILDTTSLAARSRRFSRDTGSSRHRIENERRVGRSF